jgi:hypothetical protein
MATAQGYTLTYPFDPSWYLDNAAIDYMMNALGHLSIQEPYNGIDRVRTTDGSGMRISHICQASLLSPTSRQLHLCNVLRVPSVTRNLLSSQKFTTSNDVFV